MNGRETAIGLFLILFLASAGALVFGGGEEKPSLNTSLDASGDPLFQGEGHDHSNASQHVAGTDNIELLDFNSLSTPGNEEVSFATTPGGNRTYA